MQIHISKVQERMEVIGSILEYCAGIQDIKAEIFIHKGPTRSTYLNIHLII